MKSITIVGAATLSVLALAACGTSDTPQDSTSAATAATPAPTAPSAPQSPTASPEPEADTFETLTAYFEGLAAVSEDGSAAMARAASPGSPAAAYAAYWRDAATLAADKSPDVRVDQDSVTITSRAPDGTSSTSTYGDFEFDDDGLLVTWAGEPGPLAERIAFMPETVEVDGVSVEFSVAYRAAGNDFLYLPVKITNDTASAAQIYADTYVQPSGQQVVGNVSGLNTTPFFSDVAPGAYVIDYIAVEGAQLGGTLYLDIGAGEPQAVAVPTPE